MLGNLQKFAEALGLQNAYPANPQSFRTGRQPEILHSAAGAVQVGGANGVAANDRGAKAGTIASDANIQRRIQDTFQFQRQIFFTALRIERRRRPYAFHLNVGADFLPGETILDHNKIPRLHEADRAG